jgi:hypothetical protein
MRIFLFILCLLAFLAGVGILAGAQSAIHEIEAFILFLISAVLLVGASVVEAINIARKRIESSMREAPSPLSTTRLDLSPASLPPAAPILAPSVPADESTKQTEQDAEKHAGTLMAQARQFAQSGLREKAISALQDVIRRYPRTSAAEKARRSLEKSGISS